MHYIANTVKEKIIQLVNSANVLALLSDGSQARKNNKEKELGKPEYFTVSLLKVQLPTEQMEILGFITAHWQWWSTKNRGGGGGRGMLLA